MQKLKASLLITLTILLLKTSIAWAIGEPSYIDTLKHNNYFTIAENGKPCNLLLSTNDYAGVLRAANDLKTDITKVSTNEPLLAFDEINKAKEIIIIGTIGHSTLIDQLIKNKKLNTTAIIGKWEHFQIQIIKNPFPGIEQALVIAGSDKRGTIFGIYDLSEQIGVSPWYYWADVAIQQKTSLYFKPGIYTQGPSVKYRGIFINDEAPALTNWIKENYGTVNPSTNPPIRKGVPNYNSEFYAKVFELMLRLKANYLWPAMWENAFNEDDPENPRLADEYGIIMGTSHQEPMIRSQQEWDRRYYKSLGHWDYNKYPDTLQNFWREGIKRNKDYESIITLGLRGANDSEMHGDLKDNIAMVEKIVNIQQQIISEEIEQDINDVPQSWCLYKEIMDYYNEGMEIPENITLLWADDNWGNIRRLPNNEERQRKAGAGVYYHFDYHGGPRSYQWINTNPIAKIWDQMHLAKEYGADKIWIVNVGSFRGLELPTEYFMNLAWNTNRWTNTNINEYTQLWAEREFGKTYAKEIAYIITKYTQYNGRRKPESLSPDTYSLIHYNEAETIVADYNKLTAHAEALYQRIKPEQQNAFYHLVLFPTKASALVNEFYFSAALNNLYAQQGRASTNKMATRTQELFNADTALMGFYNRVFANGKWNHFMDQAHLGYTNWNPPAKNNMDAIDLKQLNTSNNAAIGISIEGSTLSWPKSKEQAQLPVFDRWNNKKHYIEIFNNGTQAFDYKLSTNVPWISLSQTMGCIENNDQRIWIDLLETKLPQGTSEGAITITGTNTEISIVIKAFNPSETSHKNIQGFIESGQVIAIEAEHFTKNIEKPDRAWIKVEEYGLTLSGMRATAQANAKASTPGIDAPCLEYQSYFFSKGAIEINLVTSPLLNFLPNRDIKIAVSIDNLAPQYLTVVPDKYKVHWSNPDWQNTVLHQSRHIQTTVNIPEPGSHTLKIWMIDPGVIVQKIILNTGGLKPSYLGPPESIFIK